METFESLVKLASLGTSGVCVLIVFIIGGNLFRLKNDTPEWKVSLIKKFMNTCMIIAIITGISGGANAYFNYNKAKIAKDDFIELGNRYEKESAYWNNQKTQLESQLSSIKRSMQQNILSIHEIENLEKNVSEINLKSKAELIVGLKTNKNNNIKIHE